MARAPVEDPDALAPWASPPTTRRVVIRLRPIPPDVPSLPYEDGIEGFLVRHGLAPEWPDIAHDFPGVTLRRVFVTLDPGRIADLQSLALRMRPGGFNNLLLYFVAEVPVAAASRLLSRIRSMQVVEEAFLESPPTPPPSPGGSVATLIAPAYWDQSPTGIGAKAVQAVNPNARGQGIRFADIEQGWYIHAVSKVVNHVDLLPAATQPQVLPVTMDDTWGGECQHMWANKHGLRVIGVLRAGAASGVEGIAPESNGFCVCEIRPATDVTDRADAILTAAAHLQAGDVLLLEMHITDSTGNQTQLYPVETESPNRDAISCATAIGIVVIEATGNGADAVGGGVYTMPPGGGLGDLDLKFQEISRRAAGFIDSGAVLVAGASSTHPHKRLSSTRYGSRVDCYAWGENVITTDTMMPAQGGVCTTAAPATDYMSSFEESSSASAIVAGAALVVQSIHKATYGFPASAWQVRDLLKVNGTPSDSPPMDLIGVMPNLEGIAAAIVPGQVPRIYLRDSLLDTGEQPYNGPTSNSPDIIVRRAPVPGAAALYGQGGGHENDEMLSESVLAGRDNTLYVRLLNNSNVPSGPVSVNVYWSEVGTLIRPSTWRHIGADHTQPSAVVPTVPPGNVLTVSGPITWLANEIPASGHYCFVALIGCLGDPAPPPLFLDEDWANFYKFIQTNNNVSWKNFNVVDPPLLMALHSNGIPFIVAGANRRVMMALEASSTLSPDAHLVIDVPEELEQTIVGRVTGRNGKGQGIRLDATGGKKGPMRLGAGEFPAGARWTCHLRLDGPPPKEALMGDVWIRQLCVEDKREVEVGRVTWRFMG